MASKSSKVSKASKASKASKQAAPPPIEDPIVNLWNRWKNRIYLLVVAILGVMVVSKVLGMVEESSLQKKTDSVIALQEAASPEEAEDQLAEVDGDEVRAAAEALVIDRFVESVGHRDLEEVGLALSKAARLGKDLAENQADTFAGKLFAEGAPALGRSASGVTPAQALEEYSDPAVVDSILKPVAAAKDAPRLTLKTTKGDLEFILYPDRASKLCEAFSKAVQEGSFEDLLVYLPTDTRNEKGFQFGDSRVTKKLPEKAYPPENQWGRGPNLAPVAFEENGLFKWKGWVGAVVDQRTGRCSAREIVVFVEGVNPNSNAYGASVAIQIFARLSDASLDVAKEILADLEKIKKDEEKKPERPAILPAS